MSVTHEFFVGDRVSLVDIAGTHFGVVEQVWTTGLVSVRWESGALEKVPYRELTKELPIKTDLSIHFVRDDFEDILSAAGIDPDSVTPEEWRKFTDRFLDGTHWHEIAGYAVDAIFAERGEQR
jgi:hypothetical protein